MSQKVKNARHVIIGGAGFLGKNLVKELLHRKKNVFVIDKYFNKNFDYDVKILKCDISDKKEISKIKFFKNDIIHHLASNLIKPNKPRFQRYNHFAKTTINGTKNIIYLMKKFDCKKIIFWSTDMVYGFYDEKYLREDNKTNPFGDYGKTKVEAENLLKEAINKYNINCTIFRPRLILGPSRLGILKILFDLIRLNLPVPMIGRGENFFQFVSVTECAIASIMAADLGCPTGIYNLGSESPYKVRIILKDLIKHHNSKSILIPFPEKVTIKLLDILNFLKISPLDIEQYKIANQNIILDTSKVYKDIGWRSSIDDTELLKITFDSYINEKSSNI